MSGRKNYSFPRIRPSSIHPLICAANTVTHPLCANYCAYQQPRKEESGFRPLYSYQGRKPHFKTDTGIAQYETSFILQSSHLRKL